MKYQDASEAILMDGSSREVGGYDDCVSLSGVAGFVLQSHDWTGGADLIAEGLSAVRGLLTSELMTAGDLSEAGFVPWSLSPQQSFDRIEREWRIIGPRIHPSQVCWLANTPKGNAFVAALRGGMSLQ